MRIALVTGIYPPDIGGPATHAADLATELRLRGHRVLVMTLGDTARWTVDDEVVRIPRRWPWPLRLAAAIAWLVRQRPAIDVIYAVGLAAATAVAARMAAVPMLLRVPADPAWERARRLGLTRLSFDEFQRLGGGPVRVQAMKWLRNWCTRQAAIVVVPSSYLDAAVRAWSPDSRIEIVPSAARVKPPSGQDRVGQPGELRAIWAGRLVKGKRVDLLLEALALTEGTRLNVVGDGPEQDAIESRARDLGISDRVSFLGRLDPSKVQEELALSDVLLLGSDHEGLPHVAVEARAAGVPVVAPDGPWAREVVVDGETGALVPEVSPEAFAAVLRRLRDDVEWRLRLGRQAREQAKRWSLDTAVDRIERLLAEAVGKPRAVFVGKGGLAPIESLPSKFGIIARYLKATVVSVRPGRAIPRTSARIVAFPRTPRAAASVVYYTIAPLMAAALGARGRAVVVCQSPYDSAGLLLLRKLLPRRARPRVVVEVHGDWRTASRLYGGRSRRLLAPIADRIAVWALRRADRVRAVSAEMEALVRRAGFSGEVDLFVAYSDFAAFLEPAPSPPPERPILLFVGAFELSKAVDVLVEAFHKVSAQIPEAELWMLGEGPLRNQVEQQAEALGVGDQIRLLGMRPRTELPAIIDRARCLVLPT